MTDTDKDPYPLSGTEVRFIGIFPSSRITKSNNLSIEIHAQKKNRTVRLVFDVERADAEQAVADVLVFEKRGDKESPVTPQPGDLLVLAGSAYAVQILDRICTDKENYNRIRLASALDRRLINDSISLVPGYPKNAKECSEDLEHAVMEWQIAYPNKIQVEDFSTARNNMNETLKEGRQILAEIQATVREWMENAPRDSLLEEYDREKDARLN